LSVFAFPGVLVVGSGCRGVGLSDVLAWGLQYEHLFVGQCAVGCSLKTEQRKVQKRVRAFACQFFGVWAFINAIPHLDTDNNPYSDVSQFGSRQT